MDHSAFHRKAKIEMERSRKMENIYKVFSEYRLHVFKSCQLFLKQRTDVVDMCFAFWKYLLLCFMRLLSDLCRNKLKAKLQALAAQGGPRVSNLRMCTIPSSN